MNSEKAIRENDINSNSVDPDTDNNKSPTWDEVTWKESGEHVAILREYRYPEICRPPDNHSRRQFPDTSLTKPYKLP